MEVVVVVPGRVVLLVAAVVAGVAGLLWWTASPAASQEEGAAPLASFAFLARADNPVDALAAGALAGQLGGPVFLTGSNALDGQAAEGLTATDPQVVVLAGGTAALSEQVETEVAALLPDAQIRRFAGAGRTETARLLNTLPAELGVGRPVVTGATVAGDVDLEGALTVDGVDVGASLAALTARVEALEADNAALQSDLVAADGRIDALESDHAALQGDLAAAAGRIDALEADLAASGERLAVLESTLAGVSRDGDVLTFAGMNVQVTNGGGATHITNGLGNLIVGYHEDHTTKDFQPPDDWQYGGDGAPDDRTGSHMLIVGVDHSYTSYGGILAGLDNTTSGIFASVTGGTRNTAGGFGASVIGGTSNTADGVIASVTGGRSNTASGRYASVTGGRSNRAEAESSTVAGGRSGLIAAGNDYYARIGNTEFTDS